MAEVPSYMDAALFRKALCPIYGEDIEINNIDMEVISGKGDNYCSIVYRATIKIQLSPSEEKIVTVIVKDLYKEITKYSFKEFDMYGKVLKLFEEIVNEHCDENLTKIQFGPKCYLASKEHGELYVFEDLNALGYTSGERCFGVDEQLCEKVLEKLAWFHATSMVFADKYPELLNQIRDSHFKEGAVEISQEITFGSIEAGAKHLKNYPGYEDMVEKIQKNVKIFNDKIKDAVNEEKAQFKVINHADLWLNNFLFKNSENVKNTIEDVLFVDFQLCCYGSPGIDLNFFFHSSVPLKLLQTKRYEFLRFYHQSLVQMLKNLRYDEKKIPTFDMVVGEVRRTEFYTFYTVMAELPLMCLPPDISKKMSVSAFFDQELIADVRAKMFENRRVHDTILYTLDRLNELGILD